MSVNGIEIKGEVTQEFEGILTEAALQFLAKLHRKFASTRASLLEKRIARQAEIDAGNMPDFLPETEN
ncbi:hypothetical protein IH922_03770 [candidate division KSB1 bacterium]|nr:hypothetical protein [candidate division KSB1 bacterium]